MNFYLTAIIQALCLAPMAFGIYISMKVFKIPDITTDGTFTFGAAITAIFLTKQISPLVIIVFLPLLGALAGAVTGIIHAKLKVNALLAGILVMTALYSVNLIIMGRSNLPLINQEDVFILFNVVESVKLNQLIIVVFCVLILGGSIWYVLKSDLGIAMRATGESESMVRALGIDTDYMKILGLAIANSLTAISGYLMVQFQGFADINMGIGVVIVGLGSVIIGETIHQYFNFNAISVVLISVILGAILFQMVLAIALQVGVHPNFLKLITAIFVLLIVGFPRLIVKSKE